jgi:chromosome segregation ATPase
MSNNSSSDGLPTAKVAPLVGVTHRTPNHKPAKAVGGSSPAKENKLMALLEARSQVIEKQKLTISRLQKECKDKDDLILTQSSLDKTSGNESAISLPVRIDILSRKLDEANCELDVTKSNNKSLQDKLGEKDLQINELEKEISDLKMANESSEKKIVKLEAYLKNVPTMEEHYSLKEQKTQLNSACNNLKLSLRTKEEEIISLKSKLTDIETTLNEKSVELTKTKHENETLLAKCETNNDRFVQLQSENSLFKMDVQKLQKTLRDLERQNRQDLKDMRERHRQRFNEATAKLKEQYKAVMKRNRQLEMQLLKSNDVITALDNEVKISYDRESHYKSSMAELVAQNQSLLERNLAVPDPLEVRLIPIT